MLFHIVLEAENDYIILPYYYNRMIQGMLYSNMLKYSNEFGRFLHSDGYLAQNRKFKLFAFSNLLEKPIGVDKENRKLIYPKYISFFLSSINNDLVDILMEMASKQARVELGRNKLEVLKIEVAEYQLEEVMTVKTLSPICCYSTIQNDKKKRTIYYHPYEKEWKEIIKRNLAKKYEAITGRRKDNIEFEIEVISTPKERNIMYKSFFIKAYEGIFQLRGEKSVLELALSTGLGSKNSQGFGLSIPIEKQ